MNGPLRVGVVGVRRLRQGLGEHFARWLVAAGAEVPAFIGRTPESIGQSTALLARRGIAARGFTSLDALLAAEPVDALVIASPAASHRAWLDAACAARLHVLCEKPFVWDVDDPARETARIVAAFDAAGLVLHEHCQWPETLPAFLALHPGAFDARVARVSMELSPSTLGEDALVDTVSHPVSLLQDVLVRTGQRTRGAPIVPERVEFRHPGGPDGPLEVEARFRDVRGSAVVLGVRLTRHPEQPRPAAYAIDGRRADRRIQLPAYTMTLADGGREVPLDDPMLLAVARFVRAAADARERERSGDAVAADPGGTAEIVRRMEAVRSIVFAFRSEGR